MKINNRIVIFLIFLIFTISIVTANTITVDDTGGQDYTTIKQAVDSANSGDTILVYPGTYVEHIMRVEKDLTIISKSGDPDDTIIQNIENGGVFIVSADNVNISGFTVTVTNNSRHEIFFLYGADNNTISNNKISNKMDGIKLSSSNNNTIKNNTARNIILFNSRDNKLTNNTVLDNIEGISLSRSSNTNTLENNTASNFKKHGIYIYNSNDNLLKNNMVSNNKNGITIKSSSNNELFGNDVSENEIGVNFEHSYNNRLIGNNISGNNYGVYMYYSINNALKDNSVSNNIKDIKKETPIELLAFIGYNILEILVILAAVRITSIYFKEHKLIISLLTGSSIFFSPILGLILAMILSNIMSFEEGSDPAFAGLYIAFILLIRISLFGAILFISEKKGKSNLWIIGIPYCIILLILSIYTNIGILEEFFGIDMDF